MRCRRKYLERWIEPSDLRSPYGRRSRAAEHPAQQDGCAGGQDSHEGDSDQQRDAGHDHDESDDDDRDA